jgi:protein-tyrosine phosphatase
LIDFHNHVLPDADDGPATLEQSLNMLRTAADQGITDVVNTIHLQHPKVEGRNINHEGTKKRLSELQDRLDRENIPIRLHLGAEVFYLPNLLRLKDNPLATFGHGKYMLVEFALHTMPPGYEQLLFELVMAGVTPIIAHPERYKAFQDDLGKLRKLIRSGCLVQVDAGSLIGTLGRSALRASKAILKEGLCHILGSDAHDDRKRNFCLAEALEAARELAGDAVDDMVTTHPRMILEGTPIEAEIVDADYLHPKPTFFEKVKRRFGN